MSAASKIWTEIIWLNSFIMDFCHQHTKKYVELILNYFASVFYAIDNKRWIDDISSKYESMNVLFSPVTYNFSSVELCEFNNHRANLLNFFSNISIYINSLLFF